MDQTINLKDFQAALQGRFLLLTTQPTGVERDELCGSSLAAYLYGSDRASWDYGIPTSTLLRFAAVVQQTEDQSKIGKLVKQFSKHKDYPLMKAIALGSDSLTLAEFTQLHSIDLVTTSPHILMTLRNRQAARAEIASHLASRGISLPINIDELSPDSTAAGRGRAKAPLSMQRLQAKFSDAQRETWHLLYTDAFLYIRQMLNPQYKSKFLTLDRNYKVAYCAGLERYFLDLLIARALAGHSAEQKYIRQNWSALLSSEYVEQTDTIKFAVRAINNKNFDPRFDNYEDLTSEVLQIVNLQLYVYSSEDEEDFLVRLSRAYEIDVSIIEYIDWDRVRKLVDATAGISSPYLVFLSTIISSDRIVSRFRYLLNGYWQGGATADLEHYAMSIRGRARDSSFNDFLVSLMQLPERSRQRVFRHLFNPNVVERLASILTPPILRKLDVHERVDEYRALWAQLSILEFAEERRTLPKAFIESKRSEVRSFMRHLRHAKDRYRRMIRINPHDVEAEAKRFLAGETDYVAMMLKLHKVSPKLSSSLATQLAGRLASYVCFSSRIAFDYVLSNRLRHGWLLRRLEKVVLDFEHSVPDNSLNTKSLMAEVEMVVDGFCASHLTIKPESSALLAFSKAADGWLRKNLEKGRTAFWTEDAEALAADLINELHAMLTRAQEMWTSSVRDTIKRSVEASSPSASRSAMEVEQLAASFDSAFEETKTWISVNSERLVQEDNLSLTDLVQFEVNSILVTNGRTPQLRFEVYDESGLRKYGHDVEISGQYFDVLVCLIDNVVQNGFDRSGLGSRTEITVAARVQPDAITFEFLNSFAPRSRQRQRGNLTKANKALEKARSLSPRSLIKKRNDEGGSGAVKIVFECREAFDDRFHLEAVDEQFGANWFCVRAKLPIHGARVVKLQG